MSSVQNLRWKFLQKERFIDYTCDIASTMQLYNEDSIPQILWHKYCVDEFDKPTIDDLTEKMLKPGNLNIYLISQTLKDKEEFKTEKWYGTQFTKQSFSDDLRNSILNKLENKNLDLPKPNIFLPKKTEIISAEKIYQENPVKIKEDKFSTVWFKQNLKFKEPHS